MLELAIDPLAPADDVQCGHLAGLFRSTKLWSTWLEPGRRGHCQGNVPVFSVATAADQGRTVIYVGPVGGSRFEMQVDAHRGKVVLMHAWLWRPHKVCDRSAGVLPADGGSRPGRDHDLSANCDAKGSKVTHRLRTRVCETLAAEIGRSFGQVRAKTSASSTPPAMTLPNWPAVLAPMACIRMIVVEVLVLGHPGRQPARHRKGADARPRRSTG